MVCVCLFSMLLYYHNNNCNKPFASTNWHQKEPLGCVVYSHCPINDSYNNSIHSCLPCNYVTKPFGILQRVIKSQRVHISEKSSFRSQDIHFLNFFSPFFPLSRFKRTNESRKNYVMNLHKLVDLIFGTTLKPLYITSSNLVR